MAHYLESTKIYRFQHTLESGSGPGGRRFKSSRPDHSFQGVTWIFWFFHHCRFAGKESLAALEDDGTLGDGTHPRLPTIDCRRRSLGAVASGCRRTNHAGRVHFLGHVADRDHLADIYANCDALVHPNLREPFGRARKRRRIAPRRSPRMSIILGCYRACGRQPCILLKPQADRTFARDGQEIR